MCAYEGLVDTYRVAVDTHVLRNRISVCVRARSCVYMRTSSLLEHTNSVSSVQFMAGET